jgi:Zn-dependent peptidase ImmA (M78 family)
MAKQISDELIQQPDIEVAAILGGLKMILEEKFTNLLTKALSVLPAHIQNRVNADCRFLLIATTTKALYLPNTEIGEKHLIIFPETLLEDKDGTFTILHEIAHFACGHERIRSDERDEPLDELLEEQINQEETAEALAFRWSKEIR